MANFNIAISADHALSEKILRNQWDKPVTVTWSAFCSFSLNTCAGNCARKSIADPAIAFCRRRETTG